MSHQQTQKTGKRSDAQKQERARQGDKQLPASAPVSGAFGREGEDSRRGMGQEPEEGGKERGG
jgi:hypothetical protein